MLCVEAETDLMMLGYLPARQDDDETFVLWEMAGTSHADVYVFSAGPIDFGVAADRGARRRVAPIRGSSSRWRSTFRSMPARSTT